MSQQLVGYSLDDLGTALDTMERSINPGEWCQLQFYTEDMPAQETLDKVYLDILLTGHQLTQPTTQIVEGIPVTTFNIRRDSPYSEFQWQLIVPLIIPLVVVGFLIFAITKIGDWAPWIIGTILAVGGIAIALAVLLRKPAQAYIEKLPPGGAKLPMLPAAKMKYLPSTSPKALAAR